jgi:hypothetical protein
MSVHASLPVDAFVRAPICLITFIQRNRTFKYSVVDYDNIVEYCCWIWQLYISCRFLWMAVGEWDTRPQRVTRVRWHLRHTPCEVCQPFFIARELHPVTQCVWIIRKQWCGHNNNVTIKITIPCWTICSPVKHFHFSAVAGKQMVVW